LLHAVVHAADMQDCDGRMLVMGSLFVLLLLKLYAGAADQGPEFQRGLKRACRQINVAIVERSGAAKFVVLPRRWIVERTIGWLSRCRRLANGWECLKEKGLRFLRWASIRLKVRKLCQKLHDPGWTLRTSERSRREPRNTSMMSFHPAGQAVERTPAALRHSRT